MKIKVLFVLFAMMLLSSCSSNPSSVNDNNTSDTLVQSDSSSVVESDSTFTNENSKNQTNKMTLDELRMIIQEAKAKEDPRQTFSYIRNEIKRINRKKII